MALLSFADSAPRAYRLKAGNAYLTFSTSTGTSPLLLTNANTGEVLIPPFGANGIEFNNKGTARFAMTPSSRYR
jgi:hypothetical protein